MTLLMRLRRRSSAAPMPDAALRVVKDEKGEEKRVFVVSPDAPPVPALSRLAPSAEARASGAERAAASASDADAVLGNGNGNGRNKVKRKNDKAKPRDKTKPKDKGKGKGKGKCVLPDKVLVLVFEYLARPPLARVGSAIASACTSEPSDTPLALPLPLPPVPSPSSGSGPTSHPNAQGIQALGRCTLVNRHFESLAAPILYRALMHHDGHRHDPFVDMGSATLGAARRALSLLSLPSGPSRTGAGAGGRAGPKSEGGTRKAQLLAQTQTLRVSYHWHAWCHTRPTIPRLRSLRVLRVDLDARDARSVNGVHADAPGGPGPGSGAGAGAGYAGKACRMLEHVVPGDTVVFHGISLYARQGAWGGVPSSAIRHARRVVYVLSPVRPKRIRPVGDGELGGIALHLALQPRWGNGSAAPSVALELESASLSKKTVGTDSQRKEVVIIFHTPSPRAAFDPHCAAPGREPYAPPEEGSWLAPWGWVGGMIQAIAAALVSPSALKGAQGQGGNDDVRVVTVVNARALPPPSGPIRLGRVSGGGKGEKGEWAASECTGKVGLGIRMDGRQEGEGQDELFARCLRKCIERMEKPLYVHDDSQGACVGVGGAEGEGGSASAGKGGAGGRSKGDWAKVRVPRVSVRGMGMGRYVREMMRGGEFEDGEVVEWMKGGLGGDEDEDEDEDEGEEVLHMDMGEAGGWVGKGQGSGLGDGRGQVGLREVFGDGWAGDGSQKVGGGSALIGTGKARGQGLSVRFQ